MSTLPVQHAERSQGKVAADRYRIVYITGLQAAGSKQCLYKNIDRTDRLSEDGKSLLSVSLLTPDLGGVG